MSKSLSLLFLSTLSLFTAQLPVAQVVLDGTLGKTGALPGPNYQIGADLGSQHGSNLFHSFQEFNLQNQESATFSGPTTVQNIISRVTGGNPSHIDGTLRSTIPNADLYFLNPSGIVFGANASLDVQGSFHASTAHYLRLGEQGRFDTLTPANSLLTIAPITAFGFLDHPIAPISVTGHGQVSQEWQDRSTGLSVPTGNNLSLLGGDLTLSKGTFFQIDSEAGADPTTLLPSLSVPAGQLTLASVASPGEIRLSPTGVNLTTSRLGNLTLSDNTLLKTSGEGGGSIFIRSGQFLATDSKMEAVTLGHQDGGSIDIQADDLTLTRSWLIGNTLGLGKGTDLRLQATNSLNADDMSILRTTSGDLSQPTESSLENGGQVWLSARNIKLTGGAQIQSETVSSGKGGDVTLQATEDVVIEGHLEDAKPGPPSSILTMLYGSGNAGHVLIQANQIFLTHGAQMSGGVVGTGMGGNITLIATGAITLSGVDEHQSGSQVITTVRSEGSGNAGQIQVTAGEILLRDGGELWSGTHGTGNAGSINLKVLGKVTLTGASANGQTSGIYAGADLHIPLSESTGGNAGNITIEAGELYLTEGGLISSSTVAAKDSHSGQAGTLELKIAGPITLSGVNPFGENRHGFGSGIYARSVGVNDNVGGAGQINIEANSLSISDGAVIETSTNTKAPGGNLDLSIRDTVTLAGDANQIPLNSPAQSQTQYLQQFSPSQYNQSTSGIYAQSKSTSPHSGDSGHISLSARELRMNDKATISTTSAGGGSAGDITVQVEQLSLSNNATITSSSQFANTYHASSTAVRDEQLLVQGDLVDVADLGDGHAERYIYLGDQLVRMKPATTVANVTALNELMQRYQPVKGDIVTVQDSGDGKAARFIYAVSGELFQTGGWAKIVEQTADTFDSSEILTAKFPPSRFWNPNDLPYPSGTLLRVTDGGDGKPADFVFVTLTIPEMPDRSFATVVRLNESPITSVSELTSLQETRSLRNGDLASLTNPDNPLPTSFIFQNQQWVPVRSTPHSVATVTDMNALILARVGNMVEIGNANGGLSDTQKVGEDAPPPLTKGGKIEAPPGDKTPPNLFVYTGRDWLSIRQFYQVANLTERDQLSAQTGDVVRVLTGHQGQTETYFYDQNQWVKQLQGGNAGTIKVTARQETRLTTGGRINTESVSASGGGITLKTDRLVYLQRGGISTSVNRGSGNGGDIVIDNPLLFVLNQGGVRAQADEGQGGNIHIIANHFIASTDSLVSASSRRGIDGKVVISAPNEKVGEGLLGLPSQLKEIVQLKNPCGAISLEELENRGHFYVFQIAGSPQTPEDWQPSPYLATREWSSHSAVNTQKQVSQPPLKGTEGKLLVAIECRNGK